VVITESFWTRRLLGVPFKRLDPVFEVGLDFPGIPHEQPKTDGLVGEQFFQEPSSDISCGPR